MEFIDKKGRTYFTPAYAPEVPDVPDAAASVNAHSSRVAGYHLKLDKFAKRLLGLFLTMRDLWCSCFRCSIDGRLSRCK